MINNDENLLSIAEINDNYLKKIKGSELNIKARKFIYKISNTTRKKPYVGDNIIIIWMDKKADNGLSHTRYPNLICLSEDILESDIKNVILHETVHISQRLYPNEWKIIFKYWNMKAWFGILPVEINILIRINPDTIMSSLFIWKKRWILLGLFTSYDTPNIKKIKNVWWDNKKKKLKYIPPKGWNNFFGNIDGEHPYEMAAYYITQNTDSIACKILHEILYL